MTRKLKWIIVLLCSVIYLESRPADREYFVSPGGNDSYPGTKTKPFATLDKVRQTVSGLLKQNIKGTVNVWLASGEYRITKPVVFHSGDLDSGQAEVSFRAEKGATPVLSGGIAVTGWKDAGNNIWKAPVNQAVRNGFRELFVNDKRAIRARFPNEGYLRVKQAGADRRTHFFFNPGDFPLPQTTDGMELVLLHDWSISRIAVKEIDTKTNKLTALDSIGAKSINFFNIDNWEKNPRYFLENANEFLDANYEWYFDKKEGIVYLKMPADVKVQDLHAEIPLSEGLLALQGSEKIPVKNLRFEGITFSFSSWPIPVLGYCGIQACHFDPRPKTEKWTVVPAAVEAIWTENCLFDRCRFLHLGGSGLLFGTGSKNCTVENSEFSDISGNGIMIGEGRDRKVNGDVWWKTVPGQVATDNTIKNCRVTACGMQFFGAVGIWAGLTAGTLIDRCEVAWLPYSGISIGWEWSPMPTPCRQNRITNNHIHHIMQILSDGGGIYMLGLQPGSILSGNHIHDVEINAGRAESNGMFLDEGITDVLVENNLIYNIARSPLRFHKATTNLVKGNYFFCREGIPPIRYNNTKETDIKKVDNRIFSEKEKDYESQLKKMIGKWN